MIINKIPQGKCKFIQLPQIARDSDKIFNARLIQGLLSYLILLSNNLSGIFMKLTQLSLYATFWFLMGIIINRCT